MRQMHHKVWILSPGVAIGDTGKSRFQWATWGTGEDWSERLHSWPRQTRQLENFWQGRGVVFVLSVELRKVSCWTNWCFWLCFCCVTSFSELDKETTTHGIYAHGLSQSASQERTMAIACLWHSIWGINWENSVGWYDLMLGVWIS